MTCPHLVASQQILTLTPAAFNSNAGPFAQEFSAKQPGLFLACYASVRDKVLSAIEGIFATDF
jgi:hypothetical protein